MPVVVGSVVGVSRRPSSRSSSCLLAPESAAASVTSWPANCAASPCWPPRTAKVSSRRAGTDVCGPPRRPGGPCPRREKTLFVDSLLEKNIASFGI